MSLLGSGLRFILLTGCFCLASQGAAIVSNLSGGPYTSGTNLGNGLFTEDSRNYKAFGLTILGTQDLEFISLETIFDNNALLFNRTISGGIYSDNGGTPGSELVSFVDVTLPPQVQDVLLMSTATFTLQAGQTYWFVLTGPVGVGLLPNWQRDTSNSTPGATALAAPVGYMFSGDNQATWSASNVHNQLQINVADDFPIDISTPEPSAFVMSAAGLLVLGGLIRRR